MNSSTFKCSTIYSSHHRGDQTREARKPAKKSGSKSEHNETHLRNGRSTFFAQLLNQAIEQRKKSSAFKELKKPLEF